MNKLFIAQNLGGGNLFQYKSIKVYVNVFGAERAEGGTWTLTAFQNTQEAKLCLLSQDSGSISEELTLVEALYFDFTPVSYPPKVYTSLQSWGQEANYSLVKEMGSPILLKPKLTYFTFTAICGVIAAEGAVIHDMDNIGRVNVTIRNIDTNEIETHNDVDCHLVMSSSWRFVTAVSLPKWENIEINFEVFNIEIRI